MLFLTNNTGLKKLELKCALPLMSNNKKCKKLTRKIDKIE